MATEKKYLDLQGLQHLKEQKVLVKHPSDPAASAAAVKVGRDENGHVVLGGALATVASSGSYNDLSHKPTIGNGTLTIQANGNSKGIFTANQTDNTTINITATDLGLSSAMNFRGISLTAIQDGSTTSTINIKGHSNDTTGSPYEAQNGDVVLYNTKEFIFNKGTNSWSELGDQGSHALNTVSINGDGTYITGGGNLQANRTLSHKTYTAATAAAVKVGRDSGGHVVIGGALGTADAGTHNHTITASVPANSFLTSISGTTTKISLNKSTDTFVKSYPGVTSNLVTTTITGTNGTVTASKATAGTAVSVAKAGTAVVYGKANVGAAKTVATRAASQTTVGNANVGADVTVATSFKDFTGTKTNKLAYDAEYDSATECLTLSPLDLNTTKIKPATSSSTKIYGCGDTINITPAVAAPDTQTIIPAVSNGTITPYTFADVIAAKVGNGVTVATGALATDASGAAVLTGLGTASTGTAIKSATIQSGANGDVNIVSSISSSTNGAAVNITASSSDAGSHKHTVQ